MSMRNRMIYLSTAVVLIGGSLASPMSTISAATTEDGPCADHFNWRKGVWFPEKAHSGSEIPGEGWTVDSVHSVSAEVNFAAEWHANLEGGYSNQWHSTCGGSGGGGET